MDKLTCLSSRRLPVQARHGTPLKLHAEPVDTHDVMIFMSEDELVPPTYWTQQHAADMETRKRGAAISIEHDMKEAGEELPPTRYVDDDVARAARRTIEFHLG